jgi:23S rRNA U2552 (ribose-2'-O)-methylase RlmE/FtsJ
MEITIFRRNQVNLELFKNQCLYRTVTYTDINTLKDSRYGNFTDLDNTKGLLDDLDKTAERCRRAAAKYLHEYELVKILCKIQVVSRAYFKLYEMIYFDPIIAQYQPLDCFFICEAPGGFIECIQDIRRKKNLPFKFISISKRDQNIKYGNYIEPDNLLYGDITDPLVIESTIKTVYQRFPNGLDLITGDGGFDVKVFVAQEIFCNKLILCEIYLALMTQKINGTFIVKFFDMFSHNTVIYYLLLCSFYNYVKIIKPKSSRNCNSERYLACYGFKGRTALTETLLEIIKNFEVDETRFTIVFPDFNFSVLPELKKLTTFNNIMLYEQIKTIHDSIKMVNTKNGYVQNLLLNIFIDKTPEINKIYNVLLYKHILSSRIDKCVQFLKQLGIHVHKHIKYG